MTPHYVITRTRDTAGRLVVTCEACGATHRDAPHDRNAAWQRTYTDEHRRQRPRNRATSSPRTPPDADPALGDPPPLRGPSNRVTYVEDRSTP